MIEVFIKNEYDYDDKNYVSDGIKGNIEVEFCSNYIYICKNIILGSVKLK